MKVEGERRFVIEWCHGWCSSIIK